MLALATLNSFGQDHVGKKDIAVEEGSVRSNVSNLKRDIAEIEAMRGQKTEFEAQMNALNFEGMRGSKNVLMKLMNEEIVQVRTRLGMDRQEMIESIEEAETARKEAAERKSRKKPLSKNDDRADAANDSSGFWVQKQLMIEMNRIFFEIRNIELTSKPQRYYEGSILKKADEFIALMQYDIFETKKEVQENREEIISDRKENLDDKEKRNRKRK